jgi:hypothetical protein
MDKLTAFYTGRAWRDLALRLKIERGGRCERSGRIFTDLSRLCGHHKIELTEENVGDASVSLNPQNIEIISFEEHNREHRRFGYKRKTYIVWGSPLSGKTTTVRQIMRRGDIVMDIDALWQAVSFQPEYIKPDGLRFNVFRLRDSLLDQIYTNYGNFCDAYIIGGYPDKYERERLAGRYGAELIYCESAKEECIDRVLAAGRPSEWAKYVNDWWYIYERTK